MVRKRGILPELQVVGGLDSDRPPTVAGSYSRSANGVVTYRITIVSRTEVPIALVVKKADRERHD